MVDVYAAYLEPMSKQPKGVGLQGKCPTEAFGQVQGTKGSVDFRQI